MKKLEKDGKVFLLVSERWDTDPAFRERLKKNLQLAGIQWGEYGKV